MTQIVTISATTAGYVTEGLRPSARVNGSTHTAETVSQQVQEARKADNLQHLQMRDVVGPPAIALFFMTAGERNRTLAQTTQREAEEAYFFNSEKVEEIQADDRQPGEQQQEPEDGESSDETGEEQHDVLALPSPDDFA